MNSSKPYIIRALFEWIVDNQCTPYILVAIDYPEVQVPAGYGENGQLVLNVSPTAVRNLIMNNEVICFEARFGGVPQLISVPIAAVMAIYAQENGQGMIFHAQDEEFMRLEDSQEQSSESGLFDVNSDSEEAAQKPAKGKPSLKLIK